MMTRSEAIACVMSILNDELVIAANGMISRETYFHADRETNFYMIGSMGLASSIGLGIATVQPGRRVVVIDGDGNVLMALGTLAMVGDLQPLNFVHIVLDNEVYGSTGGQRSITDKIQLETLALAAGYKTVLRIDSQQALEETLHLAINSNGPSFILVKVGPTDVPNIPRVSHLPNVITRRFIQAIRHND